MDLAVVRFKATCYFIWKHVVNSFTMVQICEKWWIWSVIFATRKKTIFNIKLNLKRQRAIEVTCLSRSNHSNTLFTNSTCSNPTSDQSIFWANSNNARSSSETCPSRLPRPTTNRQTDQPPWEDMQGRQMTGAEHHKSACLCMHFLWSPYVYKSVSMKKWQFMCGNKKRQAFHIQHPSETLKKCPRTHTVWQ